MALPPLLKLAVEVVAVLFRALAPWLCECASRLVTEACWGDCGVPWQLLRNVYHARVHCDLCCNVNASRYQEAPCVCFVCFQNKWLVDFEHDLRQHRGLRPVDACASGLPKPHPTKKLAESCLQEQPDEACWCGLDRMSRSPLHQIAS